MKKILKQAFIVFLGIFMFLIFLFLCLSIILYLNTDDEGRTPANDFLVLQLNYDIPELTNNVPPTYFSKISNTQLGLNDITKVIKASKEDNRIRGIVLRGGNCQSGLATIQTLRNKLEDFQTSGKPIYAYADAYSQSGYYLSSIADSLFVNPNGNVTIKGFGATSAYYKDGMDKYDIEVDIAYRGKYKSGTEKYRRNAPSEENIYQLTEYLEDVSTTVFTEIGESRGMSHLEIDNIAENYLSRSAISARELGLIDSIRYERGFRMFIRSKLGLDADTPINEAVVNASNYLNQIPDPDAAPKIAVIYAEGNVSYKTDETGTISNKRYRTIWNKLINDEDVKGIVIRANTPGGSAFESDVLWKEIKRIKAKKFVTLSMGDYCASGGYYFGCAVDTIVAHDVSLTGSIGAYAMNYNFHEFLDKHIGVDYESISTHPYVNLRSSVIQKGEAELAILDEEIERVYRKFLNRVAVSRQQSQADIHKIGQGRIWSGEDALSNALVDEIGDLDRAIEITAERLGLDTYAIVEYPKIETSFVDKWIPRNVPFVSRFAQTKLDDYVSEVSSHFFFSGLEGDVLVRMPFRISL